MTDRPNIAIVVLDTLRKDTFDQHFGWLAKSSASYNNAWSTSHWTVPAHASLFTGRYASEVGTHAKNRHFTTRYPALSELLSSEGYQSVGLTANASIGPEMGFGRGFDEYRTIGPESRLARHTDTDKSGVSKYIEVVRNVVASDDPTLPTLRDAASQKWPEISILNRSDNGAADVLEVVTDRDFSAGEFLFLNLMEAHSPYRPPAQYLSGQPAHLTSFSATVDEPELDPDCIQQAYEDAARYLSETYREIHSALTEDFDYVITLSDHGEALGEQGYWGHSCVLPPEITRIPLVVWDREGEVAPTDSPVSLLDVFQTVLDVAGVDRPAETRGQSLVSDPESERRRFVETHGLTEQEIAMLDRFENPKRVEESYSENRHAVAVTSGYAFETTDQGLVTRGELEAPEESIQAFLADREVASETAHQEVPESVKQQLEHLGYA